MYPYGTEKLVDALIIKFLEQRVISDVKEFREIRKAMGYFERISDMHTFKERLSTFLEKKTMGLEIFASPEIDADKTYQNVLKYVGISLIFL